MNLHLKRVRRGKNSTLGELYINGVFECYTLEDEDRNLHSTMTLGEIQAVKVWGATAIPVGVYPVGKKFWPKHNRDVPTVSKVPGFAGILIHSGNTVKHTEGCPLVGQSFNDAPEGFTLNNSKAARLVVDKKIFEALERNESVTLTVEQCFHLLS